MAKVHTIRQKGGALQTVELTRGKAIKYFCYECMGWQKQEVRNCTAPLCPLFPYRPLKTEKEMEE